MPPFSLGHWHRFLAATDLDDTLLTLGTCIFILGLVGCNRAGSRWAAPIRWLGQLSYEVYLTHEFIVIGVTLLALRIGRLTGKGLGFGMFAWSFVTLLLSAIVGWLIARFFTERMNRLLRGAPHPIELPANSTRT